MIDVEKIDEIFKDCLFKDDEILDNGDPVLSPTTVKGITMYVGFNPERLISNENEINNLINQLHPNFKEGWTFLNMCFDSNDNLWTGSHKTMEKLLILGLAIKKIEYCCDREMWSMLPEGMPYIRIIY